MSAYGELTFKFIGWLLTWNCRINSYYYAIVTCDSVEAANHIYVELDGTELERTANVFDLSFVPDDLTFDDDFRYDLT